jgi:hypothetical protein
MCFLYCYRASKSWCTSLTCSDILNFLLTLTINIANIFLYSFLLLPLLSFLILFGLTCALAKTPHATYLTMCDSYQSYLAAIDDGASTYMSDGTVRSTLDQPWFDRLTCADERKRCKGECACCMLPLFICFWITIPVQMLVVVAFVSILMAIESVLLVQPPHVPPRLAALRTLVAKRMRAIDESTSIAAFGNRTDVRFFKPEETTNVVTNSIPRNTAMTATAAAASAIASAPPHNLQPEEKRRQEEGDAILAQALQDQEDHFVDAQQPEPFLAAASAPPPPPEPVQVPVSPEAARQNRQDTRQAEILEGGRRVVAGFGMAARLAMTVAAAAAKEAKRAYDESRDEQAGNGAPGASGARSGAADANAPVAVAYPVTDAYTVPDNNNV